MVARFSSLFVGVGWQETLEELWDWLGSPATVRVMGLVTGRFPPGPTYTGSEKDVLNIRMRHVSTQWCISCFAVTFLVCMERILKLDFRCVTTVLTYLR